jgi:hypothetical protein
LAQPGFAVGTGGRKPKLLGAASSDTGISASPLTDGSKEPPGIQIDMLRRWQPEKPVARAQHQTLRAEALELS